MDGADDIYLMEHPDSLEEIPVLDIAPYLAGEPGALERLAKRLREVSETVGFFYLVGHGVPQDLIDRTFAESARLHTAPFDQRMTIEQWGHSNYRPIENRTEKSAHQKPSYNSSFSIRRERPAGHAKSNGSTPFRHPNAWPNFLPGFKERTLDYYARCEELAHRMLPLWATALDLPPDYFKPFFGDPHVITTLIYYPPQKEIGNRQYGVAPHTDNSLMTLLMQKDVPGLAIQMPSGHWRVVDIMPGAFIVNAGNTMTRFTNGRFKSTKHRVINQADRDRYSLAVFVAPDLDATVECVPTCVSAEHPAQFEPIVYEDLYRWYQYGSNGARGAELKAAGPEVKSATLWVPSSKA